MRLKELSKRIQQLVDQSKVVLSSKFEHSGPRLTLNYVDSGKLAGLRASVLSFITMLYGKEHSHYSEFNAATDGGYESNAKKGYEILLAIQNEIDGGWIFP